MYDLHHKERGVLLEEEKLPMEFLIFVQFFHKKEAEDKPQAQKHKKRKSLETKDSPLKATRLLFENAGCEEVEAAWLYTLHLYRQQVA